MQASGKLHKRHVERSVSCMPSEVALISKPTSRERSNGRAVAGFTAGEMAGDDVARSRVRLKTRTSGALPPAWHG